MNASPKALFSLSIHHLSTDAKRAGAELPDAQLSHLSTRQLRSYLELAAKLAPTAVYPAEPSIRIEGPTGKFVVQLKGGALQFVSWSTVIRASGTMTPAQIIEAISVEGEDENAEDDSGEAVRSSGRSFIPSLKVILGVLVIVAINSFTVLFVTRPPRTREPKFTYLEAAPAERLLADVAGVYETTGPGERRLEIRKDGSVNRIKYSSKRSVLQKQDFSVKAAQASGQPTLVTNRKTLITILDPTALVLYGDTYRRVTR